MAFTLTAPCSVAAREVVEVFLYGFLGEAMAIETTYTEARQNLARLLDRVAEDREIVYIRRRGRERVAMLAADELAGLVETAHLLRSPRNAARLTSALRRALERKGRPQSLAKLRRSLGLDDD